MLVIKINILKLVRYDSLKKWKEKTIMLKIFQTGDNHIGLKYANRENKSKFAKCRIEAFENMVKVANQEKCSLFVITGDLFENTSTIQKSTIKEVLKIVSAFNGIVVVLPGNHDFYNGEAKVWKDFEEVMETYDNIMLLKEYQPYKIEFDKQEVVIYPAFCEKLHSNPGQNNIGWIKEENIIPDAAYRIGIVHGAIKGETIDKEGQYFLMDRAELEAIPMDVWLIGHTHVPIPCDLTENYTSCDKIFNAGCHVQTDVSCNCEGQCFIIEIDENKNIRAKKVYSGNVRFYRKNINLSPGNMENILQQELKDMENNSFVEIILSGAVSIEEYENRNAIIENVLSRFIESKYNDSNLSKIISKELIESEFPETSFSAGLLTELLDEPKEAQLAYELLNSLKEAK